MSSHKSITSTISLGLVLAIIAGAAALATNLDTLRSWWCNHIGYFCSVALISASVLVDSGGGSADVCGTHTAVTCIHPSSPSRHLIPKAGLFHVTSKSSGVFIDGTPDPAQTQNPIGTSNIGWLHKTDNPDAFCVTVYARTSACETRVFIQGSVEGQER